MICTGVHPDINGNTPVGTRVCYIPEGLTGVINGWNGIDYFVLWDPEQPISVLQSLVSPQDLTVIVLLSISEVNAYWSGITAWVSWVQNTPGKVKIIIDSVWKTSYDGAAGINSLPIGQSPAINDTLDHIVCIEVF